MKRSRVVLVVAAVLGVLAGLLVPLPDKVLWSTPFLVGLAFGELVFAGATLWHVFRTEQPETEEAMADADGGRTETDIVVVIGALASLAGIATVLASSGDKSVAPLEAAICLGAVAASWLAIHAVYTMRYARHYYVNERGCVDFNNDDKPSLADFAYLAYCLGMTYQVSDTDLKTKGVRRIVFFHTLLSYVFGTGVIASTINLVIGMAQ
ncbi:MAG: DUF1345 domain-containing protein [Tetrasphaera sp.]|nr:DUF1345 domain-containing protein [Tetrasphaera sp.]